MSILIKGMDMPKNCRECPFLQETSICYEFPDCPLVEVKTPHGRLIDADEVLTAMDTWDKFGFSHTGAFVREPVSSDYVPYVHYEDMAKCVKNMPTVIEAEE